MLLKPLASQPDAATVTESRTTCPALQLCPDSMAAFHAFSRARVAFAVAAALGVAALLFHFVAGDLVDQWKLRDAISLQAPICRDTCKLVSRGGVRFCSGSVFMLQ